MLPKRNKFEDEESIKESWIEWIYKYGFFVFAAILVWIFLRSFDNLSVNERFLGIEKRLQALEDAGKVKPIPQIQNKPRAHPKPKPKPKSKSYSWEQEFDSEQ